jgi:hypothetical protein
MAARARMTKLVITQGRKEDLLRGEDSGVFEGSATTIKLVWAIGSEARTDAAHSASSGKPT